MKAEQKNTNFNLIKESEVSKNKEELLQSSEKFMSIIIGDNQIVNTHNIIASIYDVCAKIGNVQNDLSREEIIKLIQPIRNLLGQSPFIKRLQDWPRGYAGDYETINYIVNSKNKAERNTIPFFFEEYALSCAAAQQHRNKITAQSSKILSVCHKDNKDKKILSLACGSNIDIQNIEGLISQKAVHFTLFDMDNDALNYSKVKLKNIAEKCTFIQGDIFKTRKLLPKIEYDLIIIGGLFDYLSDKAIVMQLKYLFSKKLKIGGTLFFTNIAEQNPFGIWMRYIANWDLIERDRELLVNLLEKSGISNDQISISKEGTNLTNIVEVVKKSEACFRD